MKTTIKQLVAGAVVILATQAVWAEPVGPSPKATNILSVPTMKADDNGKIFAQIASTSSTAINATYKFSKWNGSSWVDIKSGNVNIPAKDRNFAIVTVPRTKEIQRVRIDVTSPSALTAKELKMAAKKVYVLKYKTERWVQIAYQFQKTTNELIGQGVNAKIAEAKALGFATKRKTDKTTVVFGTDSYRTYAYAKADNWHEKTFDSFKARDTFKRNLYKLVPSYTNDGPGLNTREETR